MKTDNGRGELDPKMLERVRALLAKAESTEFPDEAEALTVKAQQLMARYCIDAAMVDQAAKRASGPTRMEMTIPAPYVSAKATLLAAVAQANRCEAVWSNGGRSTVFGYDADLRAVELLFVSLLLQATSTMLKSGNHVDARGRSRTKAFRRSFLLAFAGRIAERLREADEAAVAESEIRHGASLVPVLEERKAAVRAAMKEAVPHLRTYSPTASHRGGLLAGLAAADRADLGTGTAITHG